MTPSPSILEAIDNNVALALRSRYRARVTTDARDRYVHRAHFVTWSCRAADLAVEHRIASPVPLGWWELKGAA